MARLKSKRTLTFNPKYRDFLPSIEHNGVMNLHHDEIEAIYLMDFKGMYQEEAAQSMGVSRPTFSRIIKDARRKISTALVVGKKIHIEDSINNFVVAFMCDNIEKFGELGTRKQYIIVAEIEEEKIKNIYSALNPLYQTDAKPAMILPSLFASKKVDYFLTDKIGAGLKNSLYAEGIFTIIQKSVSKKSLAQIQI